VDVDAVAAKVKQEFSAKEKAKPSRVARKPEAKTAKKPATNFRWMIPAKGRTAGGNPRWG